MNLRVLNPNEKHSSLFRDSFYREPSPKAGEKERSCERFDTESTQFFDYETPLSGRSRRNKVGNSLLDVSPIMNSQHSNLGLDETIFRSEMEITKYQTNEEIYLDFGIGGNQWGIENNRHNTFNCKNEFQREKKIEELKIASSKFKNGLRSFKDGLFFSSDFSDRGGNILSSFTGYGLFWYKTGDLYIGSWLRGVPHGYGYYYFINNGVFFGEIKEGNASGLGLFYKPSEEFFYEGNFELGMMSGKGFISYKQKNYQVVMKNGKIAYSEKLPSDFFLQKYCPEDIKSHEDEFQYLSMWLNPSSKSMMQDILYNAKRKNKFWKKIYFGERQGKTKHGVGTIFRSDGSRYHGMFYDNKALGLGISADSDNNFDLGFFQEKIMRIFGVTSQGKGDIYFGGIEKGNYYGPGVCYNHKSQRWLFGKFEDGEPVKSCFNRSGRLKRGHYILGDFMDKILKRAFGNIQTSTRRLNVVVMKEADHVFRSKTDSKENERKINDQVFMENKYFFRKFEEYFCEAKEKKKGKKTKKIFGPEWEALKKKSGNEDSPSSEANHQFERDNDLENFYNFQDFGISKEEFNQINFIESSNQSRYQEFRKMRNQSSTNRSREDSQDRNQINYLVKNEKQYKGNSLPPKVRKRYPNRLNSNGTTNYSRNGTSRGRNISKDKIDLLSIDGGSSDSLRKKVKFGSSRAGDKLKKNLKSERRYESLEPNVDFQSSGSFKGNLNLSDCMSMGEEQDHDF